MTWTQLKPDTLGHVEHEIDRILIDRHRIAQRVKELGAQIARDLDRLDNDTQIMLIPVMTGAVIFVADLMRHLPQKIRIGIIDVESYPGKATSSQGVTIAGALPGDLHGKHVLIVDDILDSGRTIRRLRDECMQRGPASVHCCVLLRKKIPAAMATPCEYVGFEIEDEFVVGYGLDYNNYYRNLPDICIPREDAM